MSYLKTRGAKLEYIQNISDIGGNYEMSRPRYEILEI